MEPTYYQQFIRFVKYCYREKITSAFKGGCLGLFGSIPLFWSGPFVGPVVIYIMKGVGTLLFTGATTLISCYMTYRFDKWKNRNNSDTPTEKDKAA